MFWKKTLVYWKSFLVFAIITYVSFVREPEVSLPKISSVDKWGHLIMYVLLTLALLWDSKRCEVKGRVRIAITMILPIVIGGLIEIIQDKFFYPRTGDWQDWAADCIGVLVACGVWWIGSVIRNVRGMAK